VRRLARFARVWDLVANSGRFGNALPRLLRDAPFERFLRFSDWLDAAAGRTHGLAIEQLYELVHAWLIEQGDAPDEVAATLAADYRRSGARGRLAFAPAATAPVSVRRRRVAVRQARHLQP
jgi:hypothetical protein